MSGVKNLRAMFENKGDDPSPPDRGRSPGIPGNSGSNSPRPLSKVRSSFVAIEKDGVIGLRRDPSYEPSPSRRPPSTDMETASNSSVIGADDTYKTPASALETILSPSRLEIFRLQLAEMPFKRSSLLWPRSQTPSPKSQWKKYLPSLSRSQRP
ncbi:hypothetical protein V2G26_011904 [Clonostachys chloroleuca]